MSSERGTGVITVVLAILGWVSVRYLRIVSFKLVGLVVTMTVCCLATLAGGRGTRPFLLTEIKPSMEPLVTVLLGVVAALSVAVAGCCSDLVTRLLVSPWPWMAASVIGAIRVLVAGEDRAT